MMRELLIAMSQSTRLGHLVTTNRLAWSAARRFIAGHDIDEALAAVAGYQESGLLTTLDHLGENVSDAAEADASCAAYLEAIDRIRDRGPHTWISLKLTALGMDLGTG